MKEKSTFCIWFIIFWISLLWILIGVILRSLINYYQLRSVKSTIESSKNELLRGIDTINNTMKKHKHLKNLNEFKPLKTYKTYEINSTTSIVTLDALISEARDTKRYSFVSYSDESIDKKYYIIEFIQMSSSIIVNIEQFPDDTVRREKIDELWSIIFCSSNIIQTWGDVFRNPMDFYIFDDVFTRQSHKQSVINIQDTFKEWYNKTFHHDDNCGQIIDFIDIDGPLCSCSHRPYKSSNDKWSLSMAVMHTFYENLPSTNDHILECLAITKLAMIVGEDWNRQRIESSMRSPFECDKLVINSFK